MSSIQERLQLKREPIDKWSVREQLCLASAVARSGNQNWMSVSRSLKPFGDPNRPADWFDQKNCAAQYGALLGNVETPKRKKRQSGGDAGIETPAESILRRLLTERQAELKKLLIEEKTEFLKLQEELAVLQAGKVSEEQLDKWCKEIDDEENRKEQESIAHAQWLKERELRKQEIERAWRPTKPALPVVVQKRKATESIESLLESEQTEEQAQTPTQENPKPALSPLLTSLLKSPSQVQNVATSSILHSAITNQRPVNSNININSNNSSSMIANLLNSSTAVTVSPQLQQLVTTAIGQEPLVEDQTQPIGNDILDDPNLPNLKLDDLANSILVQDGPLPEIKKEEVDDIISEIIENAHDIVADPEQHLQLDGNGDININLELDDFEEEEAEMAQAENKDTPKDQEKPFEPTVDPFEFQEDPIIFDQPKPSSSTASVKHIPQYQQQPATVPTENSENNLEQQLEILSQTGKDLKKIDCESVDESLKSDDKSVDSSETPDVADLDKEGSSDDNSKPEQEISESKAEQLEEDTVNSDEKLVYENKEVKIETDTDTNSTDNKEIVLGEESSEASDADSKPPILTEIKQELNISLDEQDNVQTTITPDFTEELYDDISMEVKVDKTGKAKRDYSRTKKKEEKNFDMLLSIEKAHLDDDTHEESSSDKEFQETDKKDIKLRLKTENERSNSPWTEEEDNMSTSRSKRRYSTSATPSDSVPNSPASSVVFCDDDRDYRNWKKSVMLVYNRLATNKYASLFLKPITEDQAPGYNKVVYRPMDLQTIKKNVETGVIRTTLEFKRDILLMFTNAIMYNKTGGTVYNMAKQMQNESMQPVEILMQAQNSADAPPVRRETRTSESGCKRKRTNTGSEEGSKSKKRKED